MNKYTHRNIWVWLLVNGTVEYHREWFNVLISTQIDTYSPMKDAAMDSKSDPQFAILMEWIHEILVTQHIDFTSALSNAQISFAKREQIFAIMFAKREQIFAIMSVSVSILLRAGLIIFLSLRVVNTTVYHIPLATPQYSKPRTYGYTEYYIIFSIERPTQIRPCYFSNYSIRLACFAFSIILANSLSDRWWIKPLKHLTC